MRHLVAVRRAVAIGQLAGLGGVGAGRLYIARRLCDLGQEEMHIRPPLQHIAVALGDDQRRLRQLPRWPARRRLPPPEPASKGLRLVPAQPPVRAGCRLPASTVLLLRQRVSASVRWRSAAARSWLTRWAAPSSQQRRT
ncbi:MAG: hypothetical protein R2911_35180 [Caldilineaceae bacterium]